MIEVDGDIWDRHQDGHWIAITTNGETRGDGAAVMGRGVALEAARTYPALQRTLGRLLRQHGNHVFALSEFRILTLPVKVSWRDPASLPLILSSLSELRVVARALDLQPVFLVRPGCGNGGLDWERDGVRGLVAQALPSNHFIVVERKP